MSMSVLSMPDNFPLVHFFFNYTATTEIYSLSLHDALPILHYRYTLPLHSPAMLQTPVRSDHVSLSFVLMLQCFRMHPQMSMSVSSMPDNFPLVHCRFLLLILVHRSYRCS